MRMTVATTLLMTALLGVVVAWAQTPPEQWRFDVFLNDREIGYHNFTLSKDEEGKIIESEARFKVKFLFFNAFQYEHENTEIWREGCLKAISSSTDSNGKEFSVVGAEEGDSFVVETEKGQESLGECIMTFAYWDKDFLRESRLLNPQTGEFVEVDAAEPEPGLVQIGDQSLPVERYRLTGKGVDIEVAYAVETGDWVALDSEVKGRTLSYRRRPADLESRGTAVAAGSSSSSTRLYE